MATFNLVGLYEIIPSQQSLILAAKFHGYDWLLNKDGNYEEEIDWNEFKNLGLVEAQVFGDYSPGDMSRLPDRLVPFTHYVPVD